MGSNEESLREGGLDVLSSILSILRKDDERICNDLPLFLRKLELGSSSLADAEQSLRLLQAADEASDLLRRQISASMDHIINEKKALYRQCSIEALPDEIISMVAENVHKYHGQRQVIVFSHVCRRWRYVALHVPSLWCLLPGSGVKMTQLLLERSKNAPLDVRFSRLPEENTPRHIRRIMPHFQRVRSFGFSLESYSEAVSVAEFIYEIKSATRDVKAPALETLEIHLNSFDEDDVYEEEIFHFYSSWNMPALRTVRATNFIPQPVFGGSLRSFSIQFSLDTDDEDCETWDLSLLLDFLNSVPQLEDLSISIYHAAFKSDITTPPVTLEALKSLTLSFNLIELDINKTIERLMESIITPNVTVLSIDTLVKEWSDLEKRLDHIFCDTDERFIHVERLNIMVRRDDLANCRIDRFFSKIPLLSHLTIEADGVSGTRLWENQDYESPLHSKLPPIRRLKFAGFLGDVHFSEAENIASAMEQGRHWDKLERFEVNGCPCFEENRKMVEFFIPKEKLVWTERKGPDTIPQISILYKNDISHFM